MIWYKNIEIIVLLKYLSNFWRPLVSCLINHILTWSANYFIGDPTVANQVPTFAVTDTNIFPLVVTLSTQDDSILLLRLLN